MSSLPLRRIELNLFADPQERVTSIQENQLDEYLLHLPLCHGSVRIECDGGVLFDGGQDTKVFPASGSEKRI